MLNIHFANGVENWALVREPSSARFHCANCFKTYADEDDALWCWSCRGSTHVMCTEIVKLGDGNRVSLCRDCAGTG